MTEHPREPQSSIPPFGLRMQPELKEAIAIAARANNRSINAEIVQRLEESLKLEVEWNLALEIRDYIRDAKADIVERLRAVSDNRTELLQKELAELKKLNQAALNAPPPDYD